MAVSRKKLGGKGELEQFGLRDKNLSKIFAGPISPHSYSFVFLIHPTGHQYQKFPKPTPYTLNKFRLFIHTWLVINMLSQYTMCFELLPELAGAGLWINIEKPFILRISRRFYFSSQVVRIGFLDKEWYSHHFHEKKAILTVSRSIWAPPLTEMAAPLLRRGGATTSAGKTGCSLIQEGCSSLPRWGAAPLCRVSHLQQGATLVPRSTTLTITTSAALYYEHL